MKAFEKNPTVLLDPMEEQGSEVFNQEQIQQALNIARRIQKKACPYGHDTGIYNRADGRCGRCHTLRQIKYRAGKGKAMNEHHNMKKQLKRRIKQKQARIKELEGLLNEQKN